MRRTIYLLTIAIFWSFMLFAQSKKSTIEILYFKANLACCKAKACNVLETEIQNIILKNYPDSSVVLNEIKLVDEANKPLIEKYKAESQTVIILKKKRKKEISFDASDIIKNYVNDRNKEVFEKEFVSKIEQIKKE